MAHVTSYSVPEEFNI